MSTLIIKKRKGSLSKLNERITLVVTVSKVAKSLTLNISVVTDAERLEKKHIFHTIKSQYLSSMETRRYDVQHQSGSISLFGLRLNRSLDEDQSPVSLISNIQHCQIDSKTVCIKKKPGRRPLPDLPGSFHSTIRGITPVIFRKFLSVMYYDILLDCVIIYVSFYRGS